MGLAWCFLKKLMNVGECMENDLFQYYNGELTRNLCFKKFIKFAYILL
jgi:hypothetical protein